ncbi:hypothetical protein SLS60_008407 [Paraconiothyrium brasiliense]|uniref:TPR-like protein n=1 Tax=Paraconiothyrium brasiliense TaxID=300254 RepID=A0ABR3R0H4_9PLEO
MAEAVVIVGAVAAFSQLAKYGAGLARYMLSCPSEIQSIPATVEDLIEHLDWHRRVVQSLQIDPNCATGPSVQHLISRSLRITLSLQQLLTPLLSNESESKVKKLRRVFSYQKRIRLLAGIPTTTSNRQKSEAAKECAYRLHDLYPEVSFIWIQARDRSALQTSYDRLFGGTEILTKFDAQAPTIQDIMEKLDMVWEGQWVLIVDDVQPTTNRDLALRQLASLPIKNGSILFTTRNTYVAALLVEDRFILTLDPMTVGEATQMLRAHLDSGFSLDEDFSSLLEYLEYLPSPIAQAAESMRLYKLSTVQYFRLLRGQEKHRGHDSVDSYHLGARASQESSSWDFLAPLALRVSHFLRILGQYKNALHLAGHALKWLSHADHSNPSSVEIFLCESSIATLSHYLGRPTSFASRVELLLQSQTVLLKSHRPLTIRALRSKGLALQAQGRHDQAEGYHRRAIAICTSIYGHRDTKLLDEKHGLALSILGQGRAQEALGTLHDIYNVMEATLGLSNPKTLSVLANIGCALQHLSQWTEAYGVMTRALSGRNAVLGKDHPHTIHSRANLAQIYVAKGDMAGAERITKETLQIHEAKLGEDHHLSLHILNSLGYLFLGQDRYTEAAEVLHRVARKREIVLGSQHCDTLTSMFYASEAYWRMGRLDEAFELGHRVLNGRRRLNEGDASMREIEERLAEIERDRWLELMR